MHRNAHAAGTWVAALLLALAAGSAQSTVKGNILVTAASGDARLTHRGAERPARKGAVVLLPSTVRTGSDGAMELAQGATTLSIGADTVLEFPEAPARGASVERIVQTSGNAFYDVAKREGRKLRVETPYLVAVVKGTQFSVAVLDGATSISLIEGQLQILSPDGAAIVDIDAGQIALRRQGDAEISVVAAEETARVTPDLGGPTAAVADRPDGAGVDVPVVVGTGRIGIGLPGTGSDADDAVLPGGDGRVEVEIRPTGVDDPIATLGLDAGIDTSGVDVGVDTGVAGIDTSLDVGADIGTGDVDVGLDIGDVDVDVGVDLGTIVEGPIGSVDLPLDTGGTLGTVVEDVGGLVNSLPILR